MSDQQGFGGRHADRIRENHGWCKTIDGTPASVSELLNVYRRQKERHQEPCTDSPLEDFLLKAVRRIGRR